MRGAQAGMSSDQTKENFPDSQISPLKLETATPPPLRKIGSNKSNMHSDTGILFELQGIRSELNESMHKLKVFAATGAAGIPHADSDSFSKLFFEISELVSRLNMTEAKAGTVLEAQLQQVASHHELRTTVLRGFESDLVIDAHDNTLFIARKANLISVIHELSNRSNLCRNGPKDVHAPIDSASAMHVDHSSLQQQVAQQQNQIASLQHQLEDQIAHIRMAAGTFGPFSPFLFSFNTFHAEKELQKRTAVISQEAYADSTAAQACMMQALREIEKTFEIIEKPVSLASTELSSADSALLISEVMTECNSIIRTRLSAASNISQPELAVLAGLDANVQKYVTVDSEVGKLFSAAIEKSRVAYLAAVHECVQQQRRQWAKHVKALRAEFSDISALMDASMPEKAVKAVKQIVSESNRRLCCAIDASELFGSPSKPIKSAKAAVPALGKFEAVAPVSPTKLTGTGRPGSAYSTGRSKENSYAKAFAKQMDDTRHGHLTKSLFL